ncbi:RNA-binding protein [Halalkalibacter urbisdiaboli]|uniref:YlmH family RNA-binding protein n=1 Tax=Halalkalibacter urbisdiaboli TaxID=1960589 RepID=UPI000B45136C|nr:RNA-binding protein [Halalkalibacter urbisdiaboli]
MSIYQHFREEERSFVDQVLEWKYDVGTLHQTKLTDFLDPREQDIVKTVIGHDDDLSLSLWGGSSYSERKRAVLCPSYLDITDEDFQLSLFAIDYPSKFVSIEHRDVLGSLMNIGLKREKFGDIVIEDGIAQLVVASEISDYVEWNVKQIGRATVTLNHIPFSAHINPKDEWDESTATVSSLRLDVVLAEVYKLSRTKVLPYIEKGLVKVNWKVSDQASFLVKEGDHLSVRGLGRSKLHAIEGKTKKDKLRLRFGRKR